MKKREQHGFSLIEAIAVLLLVGILATTVVISLLPMVQGLTQVQENTETSQKARLAMARISRELTTVTNIVALSSSAITYQFLVPAGASTYAALQHTISWNGSSGSPVLLEGVPLVDRVDDLQFTAIAGDPLALDVALTLHNGVGVDLFAMRIIPRNIPAGGAP